jgi:mono/diheme cytochrome c family protein
MKLKIVVKRILLLVVVLLLTGLGYLRFVLPNVGPAPDLKVEGTTVRIARGAYLAEHVTVCIDCHSKRDWSRFSGPPMAGTLGMGGDLFDQKFGFPGAYYSTNITPEGISNYTDGELFRVITTGVNREGKAIFPVMPYHYYGLMDKEDIMSIIAYIRTLQPIKNQVSKSSSDFPMNFIINTIPHKANFSILPSKTDTVNYGKYLTTAAACVDCHTQVNHGQLIEGMEFGGGREFPFPDGSMVRSSNISSDDSTGIGSWTKERFVNSFRMHSDSTVLSVRVNPGSFNSIMPWSMYGKMNTEDLVSIFSYLKSVKPVKGKWITFTAAQK